MIVDARQYFRNRWSTGIFPQSDLLCSKRLFEQKLVMSEGKQEGNDQNHNVSFYSWLQRCIVTLTFRGNYFISLKMISISCLLSNTNKKKKKLEQMSLCRFEHALHNSENLDKLLRVYGCEIFVTAIVFWSTVVIFWIKTIGDTLMLRWLFVGSRKKVSKVIF